MRVLIADGDEAFLEVALHYLSRHGHGMMAYKWYPAPSQARRW